MASHVKTLDGEDEDLQFLGFFGIFKESFKIILTCPKIFIQITLALILPQSCLFLPIDCISKLLFWKIHHNLLSPLDADKVSSPTYNNVSDTIYLEWVIYWLIKVVYFLFSMILALLASSAIIYTVACIYSSKKITFKKVMSVLPTLWKRLMVTYLCNLYVLFSYLFILSSVAILPIIFFYNKPKGSIQIGILVIILLIVVILLMIALSYVTMIWQLANIVSVIEKYYGFMALNKSKKLITGKMGTAFVILLMINLCAAPILIFIEELEKLGIVGKIYFGIPCLVLWSLLSLLSVVVQTIFYLVCKSYHHESIDKSSLADHLDMYLGDYVPLKAEAIQLVG